MRIRKIDEEYAITGPLAAAAHVARHAIDTYNGSTRERLCYRIVIATDDTRNGDRAIGLVFGDGQEEADANHALFVAAYPGHSLRIESELEPDTEKVISKVSAYADHLTEVLSLNFEVSIISTADRLVFLAEDQNDYTVMVIMPVADEQEFLDALGDAYLDTTDWSEDQFDIIKKEYPGCGDSDTDRVIVHVPIKILNAVMPANNQLTEED